MYDSLQCKCKHMVCLQMLLAHDLGVQQLNTWPQYRGSISAEDGQARVVVQPQMWFLALLAFSATKEAPAATGRILERAQTTTMLRTMSSVKQSVVGQPDVLQLGLSCCGCRTCSPALLQDHPPAKQAGEATLRGRGFSCKSYVCHPLRANLVCKPSSALDQEPSGACGEAAELI